MFFGLIILTTIVWENAGKNPGIYGYAKKTDILDNSDFDDIENGIDLGNLETSENNSEMSLLGRASHNNLKNSFEIKNSKDSSKSLEIIISEEDNINLKKFEKIEKLPDNKNNNPQNQLKTKTENPAKTPKSKIPQKRYCAKCDIIQPYRTKHCNSCEACISKYDHHCFWIGGCVGELNLRKFFLMLFLQTLLFTWLLSLSLSGLAFNSENYEQLHHLPKNTFTKDYGSFVLLAIISIAALLFVAFLFFQYVLFVGSNVSMWEATVSGKITYLRGYKQGFLPFHEGIWNNLKGVFCHEGVLRDWVMPDPEAEVVKGSFNYLDNEYYSCC